MNGYDYVVDSAHRVLCPDATRRMAGTDLPAQIAHLSVICDRQATHVGC